MIKANSYSVARKRDMSARLPPRGSDLPTNIEACLQLLSAIIQKYNDQDEDDEPQENDYLQAMDLLKRINDIKGQPAAVVVPVSQQRVIQTVTQVVIQWRERETGSVPSARLQLASSMKALEMQTEYEECPFCHHLVKDKYAMARHQKRITCKQAAILGSIPAKYHAFIGRQNTRLLQAVPANSCVISEAFLLSLSFMFARAQPIIRRQKPDMSVPQKNGKSFPQRLLPKMLWKSIWDPRGAFHDEAMTCPRDSTRILIYDPSMFVGTVYPKQNMERKSLTAWPFTRLTLVFPIVFTGWQLSLYNDGGPWGQYSQMLSIDVADDEED
jgi:hypothetical protein